MSFPHLVFWRLLCLSSAFISQFLYSLCSRVKGGIDSDILSIYRYFLWSKVKVNSQFWYSLCSRVNGGIDTDILFQTQVNFLCFRVKIGIHNAILSHFPAFSKTFISLMSEIIWQLADNTEHEFFISIMLPKDAFVMYELINNEY